MLDNAGSLFLPDIYICAYEDSIKRKVVISQGWYFYLRSGSSCSLTKNKMRVWKRRVFVCGFQSKEEGRKGGKKKKSRMHTRIKKSSIIPIWLDLPKRCRKLTPRRKERGKRVKINNEKQMASRANPQVGTWQRKEKQIRFRLWTLQALIYGRFCSCGTLIRKHGIGIQPYYEIQFSLPLQASHPWDRTSLSVERRQTRHVAWYVEPSHLHGYLLLCMMMRRTSLFGPALKIMYNPNRNKICAKFCPWASRARVKKRLESQKIQQKSKIFLSWTPSWSFFSRLFISLSSATTTRLCNYA